MIGVGRRSVIIVSWIPWNLGGLCRGKVALFYGWRLSIWHGVFDVVENVERDAVRCVDQASRSCSEAGHCLSCRTALFDISLSMKRRLLFFPPRARLSLLDPGMAALRLGATSLDRRSDRAECHTKDPKRHKRHRLMLEMLSCWAPVVHAG